MNFKSISYFLGLFCFPISFLAFINILYSSYFDYLLSIDTYFTTLLISLVAGIALLYFGKKSQRKINRTIIFNNFSLFINSIFNSNSFLFKQLSSNFYQFIL